MNHTHGGTKKSKKHTAKKHTAKKHTAKKHTAKKHTAKKHTAKKHTAKKHTAKKHTAKKHNQLTIDIDFTSSDGGFSVLQSKKMRDFFLTNIKKGRNLIQTVPGKPFYVNKKTTLQLQAIKYDNYSMRPKWGDILCKSRGEWLKSNPCKIGTRSKVFVKYRGTKNGTDTRNLNKSGGFSAYLNAILNGDIDGKKHLTFVKLLRKTMKKSPVIVHNMDVDWFHLKADTE